MLNFIFLLVIGIFVDTDIQKITDYLKERLNEFNKWEYEVYSSPLNLENENFEIDNSKEFKRVKNFGYIPIVFTKGNNKLNSVVTVKLKLYKSVLVAAKDMKQNESIETADFYYEVKEISGLYDEPVQDVGIGQSLKMSIKKGRVLTNSYIGNTHLVKSGDVVEAYLQRNGLVITITAYAKQNGILGQKIRIATREGKQFYGKVEGFNKIKILE